MRLYFKYSDQFWKMSSCERYVVHYMLMSNNVMTWIIHRGRRVQLEPTAFFTFTPVSRKLFIPYLSVRVFYIEYFESHL